VSLPVSSSVVHAERDPGLHVVDAGTVEASVLLAHRHHLDLADVPHGVEMTEQEDLLRRASLPRR
jgi:hypothetical protein